MTLVKRWLEEDGRLVRLRLAAPPRHLLTRAMVAALREAVASEATGALALALDAEGAHFGYGADVGEHAPGVVAEVLPEFHALVREWHALPMPTLAIVSGRCLGGSLELALCCDVIVASRDAQLAFPEVRLGAFAPAASALLPGRVGEGNARDLLLSGRTVDAAWALRAGLAQEVSDDPEAAALAWARDHALRLSPSSQRLAARAARAATLRRLEALDAMERLYLDELMRLPDAAEGVAAFLQKRAPRWS